MFAFTQTCRCERQGEGDGGGRATDGVPAGVSRVKRSILVKIHLAVCAPPLASSKSYSLVLVALMVFHYSPPPKDVFLYTSTGCSPLPPLMQAANQVEVSGTNIYTRWKKNTLHTD